MASTRGHKRRDQPQARQCPDRDLRKTYGAGFAKGCSDNDKVSNVLCRVDEPSLSSLIRDHEAGKLDSVRRGVGVIPR